MTSEPLLPRFKETLVASFGVAVALGLGVAVGLAVATEPLSMSSVALPAMPSAVRPLARWKAVTARLVDSPKSPSTRPV